MIVPLLDVIPELSVTLIVILPLPVPLVGVTVNHDDVLLLAVNSQVLVEVIATTPSCAKAVGFQYVEPTDRVGAFCQTPIVLDTPPPVTVIIPSLETVSVFAVVLIVIFPTPMPLAGETVSHVGASLLAVHVQAPVAVTGTTLFCAKALGFHHVESTDRIGAP